MHIKALFFDLDDTLHDFSTASSAAMTETYNLILSKHDSLKLDDLKAEYRKLIVKVEEDAFLDGRTSREYRTERFTALLAAFQITDHELVESLLTTYDQVLTANLKLFEEVEKILPEERAIGRKIYLVSDAPHDAQAKALKILELDTKIDGLFTSNAARKKKSNGELFKHALEQTGLSADEVVVVGDSYQRDIKGALSCGLNCIWINRRKTTLTENEPRPTSELTDLSQLRLKIEEIENKHSRFASLKKKTLKPVLILGHPRSGTNFLAHIIKSDERMSSLIEPFSLHSRYAIENEARFWSPSDFDDVFYHKDFVSLPETRKFFQEFKEWLYADTGDVRVFKETMFFLQMEWLSLYLPDLKVVYIERDPEGVAASFKRDNLFEKWNYQQRYKTLIEQVNGQTPLAFYAGLTDPEHSSWVEQLSFIYHVRTMEARLNLNLFDHIAISYNDLANKPYESFEKIFEFMGLDFRAYNRRELYERTSETKGGTYSTFRGATKARENAVILTDFEREAITKLSRNVPLLRDNYGRRKSTRATV